MLEEDCFVQSLAGSESRDDTGETSTGPCNLHKRLGLTQAQAARLLGGRDDAFSEYEREEITQSTRHAATRPQAPSHRRSAPLSPPRPRTPSRCAHPG